MTDPIQIIFVVVIVILTMLLSVVGVELFRVLREVRLAIKRTNLILMHAEAMTASLSHPIQKFAGLLQGIQHGTQFVHFIQSFLDKRRSKSAD